ncbi:hypothetical protein H0H92_008165 [Tricholoma furcatifolium]|nr:hypothetical protein H0H92_008165 [Tricholoma furcatifolium]
MPTTEPLAVNSTTLKEILTSQLSTLRTDLSTEFRAMKTQMDVILADFSGSLGQCHSQCLRLSDFIEKTGESLCADLQVAKDLADGSQKLLYQGLDHNDSGSLVSRLKRMESMVARLADSVKTPQDVTSAPLPVPVYLEKNVCTEMDKDHDFTETSALIKTQNNEKKKVRQQEKAGVDFPTNLGKKRKLAQLPGFVPPPSKRSKQRAKSKDRKKIKEELAAAITEWEEIQASTGSPSSKLYDIASIVGRRTYAQSRSRRKYEWLIEWAGYPMEQCTWEPEKAMVDAAPFIETFYRMVAEEGLDVHTDPDDTVLLRKALQGGWIVPKRET